MPLYSKYTQSPYAGTEGKVLRADRVYVAPTNTAIPTVAANGATPAGWTDLGSIEDSAVTLDKADPDILDVTTGLFQALQGQVARKDGALTGQFSLVEYDVATWSAFTGDATFAVGAGTGIFVGGRPIIQEAVLLVGQNAVTQTEFQHYNPKSNLTWKIVDVNRFVEIQVTIHFIAYSAAGDAANLLRDFELVMY